jgi:AraC-like DNA-binding protein
MQIHSLAAGLDVSVRHLSRAFTANLGVSPKRFARLARFQRILAQCRSGRSWSEIAYVCGLTDQAHLVKEFQDIVGETPTQLFMNEIHTSAGGMDDAVNFIFKLARPIDNSITKS